MTPCQLEHYFSIFSGTRSRGGSVASKIWLDPLGNAPERTKWANKCPGALKIGKKVLWGTQNGPKNAPEQGAARLPRSIKCENSALWQRGGVVGGTFWPGGAT